MARHRPLLLALAALSLAGCKKTDAVVSARPDPAVSEPAPPLSGPVTVVISKTTVTLDSEATPIATFAGDLSKGLPAELKRSGPNDLFIVPLAAAFERERGRGRLHDTLRVIADKDTPYRLLFEVVYTASQSEIAEYDLHEDTPTGAGFVTRPPSIHPRASALAPSAPVPPAGDLNLVAVVVHEGIALKTAGGNVAPGCSDVGPGPAIGRVGDGYDLAGLAACVTKLKHAKPEWEKETGVVVTGNPTMPFHDLVDVAGALRGAHGELFPDVHMGVAR